MNSHPWPGAALAAITLFFLAASSSMAEMTPAFGDGWTAYEIGVDNTGTASVDPMSGVLLLEGEGDGGSAEEGVLLARPVANAKGRLAIRLTAAPVVDAASQVVGVEFRVGTAAGAEKVFLGWDETGAARLLRRSSGGSVETVPLPGIAVGDWARLSLGGGLILVERKGVSGSEWQVVTAVPFSPVSSLQAGVFLSTNGDGEEASAEIDGLVFEATADHGTWALREAASGGTGVTVTGAWSTVSDASASGGSYLSDSGVAKGGGEVKVRMPVTFGGHHEVFARWSPGVNRDDEVPVDVGYGGTGSSPEVDPVSVDQTEGGSWVHLGRYFVSGVAAQNHVTVRNEGTTGLVTLDAILVVERPDLREWKTVRWQNFTNTASSNENSPGGSTLAKTAGGAAWNADATSRRVWKGDGILEWRFSQANHHLIVGLGVGDPGNTQADIKYGIYGKADGTSIAIENGTSVGNSFDSYTSGDVFRIQRLGDKITYYQNGNPKHEVTVTPGVKLNVDVCFHTSGSAANSVRWSGAVLEGDRDEDGLPDGADGGGNSWPYWEEAIVIADANDAIETIEDVLPGDDFDGDGRTNLQEYLDCTDPTLAGSVFLGTPVEWVSPVNTTAAAGTIWEGSTLTKSAGGTNYNADAVSRKYLTGDGKVVWRVAGTAHTVFLGLSAANPNRNFTSLGYTIAAIGGGEVRVYEGGSPRTLSPARTYKAGDLFAIERIGTQITYYLNGGLIHTSNVSSSGNLLVDTAFNHQGGQILDARHSGAFLLGDRDEDGLPDGVEGVPSNWEEAIVNADPNDAIETIADVLPGDDFDGDGRTNLQEYLDWTDPKNAGSVFQGTPVEWVSPVNTTAAAGTIWEGSTLTKSAGGTNYNADAVSRKYLTGNGKVVWRVAGTAHTVFLGLSAANPNRNYTSLGYTIAAIGGGEVRVYEGGSPRTLSPPRTYKAGDLFAIERIGTQITYYQNGDLIHTSNVSSSGNLLVDTAFNHQGGQILDARHSGAVLLGDEDEDGLPDGLHHPVWPNWEEAIVNADPNDAIETIADVLPGDDFDGDGRTNLQEYLDLTDPADAASVFLGRPVEWVSPVNTTAAAGTAWEGSTLTKTAGGSASYNGDAVSRRRMVGNGRVIWRVAGTTHHVALGLSGENSDRHYNKLDYAIVAFSGGALKVYERGEEKSPTPAKTYVAGDLFAIERIGTQINYYKNNTLLHTTSGVSATTHLLVDTSFYHLNGRIEDARWSGAEIPGDKDEDGLPDGPFGLPPYWEEAIVAANPGDAITSIEHVLPGDDFDNDGLTNLQELNLGITIAFDPDTDDDGLLDGDEVAGHGTTVLVDGQSPLAMAWTYAVQANLADTDGDGLKDGEEIRGFGQVMCLEGLHSEYWEWASGPLLGGAGGGHLSPVLTHSSGGVPDATRARALVTRPVLSVGNASGTEGGSVTFTLTLDRPPIHQVTVSYGISSGTATVGVDLPSASGTVHFMPGLPAAPGVPAVPPETSKSLQIPTSGDIRDEPDETFVLTLHSPVEVTLGQTGQLQAVGTILDDDPTPAPGGDEDGDGLANAWEDGRAFFDLYERNEAARDHDYDRLSNLEEFQDGTEPNTAWVAVAVGSTEVTPPVPSDRYFGFAGAMNDLGRIAAAVPVGDEWRLKVWKRTGASSGTWTDTASFGAKESDWEARETRHNNLGLAALTLFRSQAGLGGKLRIARTGMEAVTVEDTDWLEVRQLRVTDSGWVAGLVTKGTLQSNTTRILVWRNGTWSLIVPPWPGVTSVQTYDINELGEVLVPGGGVWRNGVWEENYFPHAINGQGETWSLPDGQSQDPYKEIRLGLQGDLVIAADPAYEFFHTNVLEFILDHRAKADFVDWEDTAWEIRDPLPPVNSGDHHQVIVTGLTRTGDVAGWFVRPGDPLDPESPQRVDEAFVWRAGEFLLRGSSPLNVPRIWQASGNGHFLAQTAQNIVVGEWAVLFPNTDQDHDGLPDDWEAKYWNPNFPAPGEYDEPDPAADDDGDGLTNLQEYAVGGNPKSADTDGDGALDGDEVAYGTLPWKDDGPRLPAAPVAPTNLEATRVGDQVLLEWADNGTTETGFRVESRPRTEGAAFQTLATLAANSTSHTTPMPEGILPVEYRVKAVNFPRTSAPSNVVVIATDADEDGMNDGWEAAHGLDPSDPEDAALDGDGDGLTHLEEYEGGTDPRDYYNGGTPVFTIVAGNGQTGQPGAVLATPLELEVRTAEGALLVNAPVDFAVTLGGGYLVTLANPTATATTVRTDANGLVEVVFRLPTGYAGVTCEITASAGEESEVFTATTVDAHYGAEAPVLVKVSGDGQTDVTGAELDDPLVVRVETALGVPLVNAPVTFSLPDGLGGLSDDVPGAAPWVKSVTVQTDANGEVAVSHRLPHLVGHVSRIQAAPGAYPPVEFQATALAPDTDTDGDGLSDVDEINVYGTDPENADSDGDGVPDGQEVSEGTDPNDAESHAAALVHLRVFTRLR